MRSQFALIAAARATAPPAIQPLGPMNSPAVTAAQNTSVIVRILGISVMKRTDVHEHVHGHDT